MSLRHAVPEKWYYDPKWCLISGEKITSIEEMHATIPYVEKYFDEEWARREYKENKRQLDDGTTDIRVLNYPGFHMVGHHKAHPLAILLLSPGWGNLLPLIWLGGYLREIDDLEGVQKLISRLKRFDQFAGTLFEIECLVELKRAGLRPRILDPPDFVFRLNSELCYVAASVLQVSKEFASWLTKLPWDPDFSSTYEHNDEKEVYRRYRQKLEEKSGQLPDNAVGVIFIDLRTVLGAQWKVPKVSSRLVSQLVVDTRCFLDNERSISAVALWNDDHEPQCRREYCIRPYRKVVIPSKSCPDLLRLKLLEFGTLWTQLEYADASGTTRHPSEDN